MRLQNDRIIMNLPGATTEMATLKNALSEAEDKAIEEHTEREKQEARVGKSRKSSRTLSKNTSPWSVTLILKSPSLLRPSRACKTPKPKPKRPSRRSTQ